MIGCPGRGKSVFARAPAQKTGLPLYHLDMLYWNADRTTVEREVFRARIYRGWKPRRMRRLFDSLIPLIPKADRKSSSCLVNLTAKAYSPSKIMVKLRNVCEISKKIEFFAICSCILQKYVVLYRSSIKYSV